MVNYVLLSILSILRLCMAITNVVVGYPVITGCIVTCTLYCNVLHTCYDRLCHVQLSGDVLKGFDSEDMKKHLINVHTSTLSIL